MSHFSLMVLSDDTKDLETLLEPYSEHIEVPEYVLYTKEELIEKVHKEIEDFKKTRYAEYLKDPEGFAKQYSLNDDFVKYVSVEFPKKFNMSDEELYKEELKYYSEEDIDKDGNILSTYNPKSKWDWWQIGGRFSGYLRLKKDLDGNPLPKDSDYRSDCGYACDIDFSDDKEEYKEAYRFWELIVEGAKPLTESEKEVFSIYRKEWYTSHYKTKEEYAKACSEFNTYAVLTPDGVWHEPGEMSWFCVSTASYDSLKEYRAFFEKTIKEAIEHNWFITIVDCHI